MRLGVWVWSQEVCVAEEVIAMNVREMTEETPLRPTMSPRDVKHELQERLKRQDGYDVFISYAREPDAKLTRTIDRRLESWARPWFGGRAMRVFRYTTKMSASAGLRSALQAAIDDSRWLIVVLSEAAAGSRWVGEEVAHWCESKDPDNILLVVASGTLEWDDATGDFSTDSTCIPKSLRGVFDEVPRYVDFRELPQQPRRLRRKTTHVGIRDLATKIHDIPPDVLEGAHRSNVRMIRIGVTCLALLLIAATVFALVAVQRSQEADAEDSLKRANAAASRALELYDDDIDTGLLYAVEAFEYRDTPETRAALVAGLVNHRHLEQVVRLPETPYRIALSPDETRLAVFSFDQRILVWDLEERRELADEFVSSPFVEMMVFDQSGTSLALVGESTLEVRAVDDLATSSWSVGVENGISGIAFGGDSIYVGHRTGVDAFDAATGDVTRIIDEGVTSLDLDTAGRLLAFTRGNLIQVWDVSVRPVDGIEEVVRDVDVTAVGISPDGNVVSFAEDDMIGIWDRPKVMVHTSEQTVPNIVETQPLERVADIAAVQSSGSVSMWASWLPDLVTVDVQSGAYDTPPVIGSRGRRVASVGDALVLVWRTDQPFSIATALQASSPLRNDGTPLIHQLDFSPTGDQLLVIEADVMSIWDTGDGSLLAWTDDEVPCAARFSVDGASIVAISAGTSGGGAVLEERLVSNPGDVITTTQIEFAGCPDDGIDMTRDGSFYANEATVMSTATGAEVASGGRSALDSAISDDGLLLAWTGRGSEEYGEVLRILDIETGSVVEHPIGQQVWGVAFDENMTAVGLSTGRDEGAIVLWDTDFSRIATLPREHLGTDKPAGEDPVTELAIDASGDQLASGGFLGSLTVWHVDPQTNIAAACEMANRGFLPTEADTISSELGVAAVDTCAADRSTGASGRIGPRSLRGTRD